MVRKFRGREVSAMITETEAYDGSEDRASHASKGKTARTEIMFGHPGVFYIYLVYGMYYMLNIVTREHSHPAAVLIRSIQHYNGPGKLTKFLNIDKDLNALPAKKSSGLWFEDRGVKIPPRSIKKTRRIGIDYAEPIWVAKKWRFFIER